MTEDIKLMLKKAQGVMCHRFKIVLQRSVYFTGYMQELHTSTIIPSDGEHVPWSLSYSRLSLQSHEKNSAISLEQLLNPQLILTGINA